MSKQKIKDDQENKDACMPNNKCIRNREKIIVGTTIALILLLAYLYKNGSLVVAFVNGKPIFRHELVRALSARFGKQTLDTIINETLIFEAAKKAGITISKEEITSKEQELLKKFGTEMSVETLLSLQGISKEDFDRQVSLELAVEKTLGKNIIITEKDIDQFIATNTALLVATEEAKMRDEARFSLYDQKIGEMFQNWFFKLKEQAKVKMLFRAP